MRNRAIDFLIGAAIGAVIGLAILLVYNLLYLVLGTKAAWVVYGGLGIFCGWQIAKAVWPKRIKHVVPVALLTKGG